jgi:hypothetical protein
VNRGGLSSKRIIGIIVDYWIARLKAGDDV